MHKYKVNGSRSTLLYLASNPFGNVIKAKKEKSGGF